MVDTTQVRDVQDRTRINVGHEHELAYWSKRFGVTRDELRSAVEAAGPLAVSVQRYIGKQASAKQAMPGQ